MWIVDHHRSRRILRAYDAIYGSETARVTHKVDACRDAGSNARLQVFDAPVGVLGSSTTRRNDGGGDPDFIAHFLQTAPGRLCVNCGARHSQSD